MRLARTRWLMPQRPRRRGRGRRAAGVAGPPGGTTGGGSGGGGRRSSPPSAAAPTPRKGGRAGAGGRAWRARQGERGGRDGEVVLEGPVHEALRPHRSNGGREQARRYARHEPLDAQHRLELPAVRRGEGVVLSERGLP